MKKLLVLLALIFMLPCCAMDLKTFDTRKVYFRNNIKTYNNETWGDLSLKGVWIDPKKLSTRLMQEDLFCYINTMQCMSGFAEIDFFGSKIINPMYDVHFLIYKIIDVDSKKVKLYNTVTEYTIEIDLINRTAAKYKIFPNGDVNKYIMLFDCDKAAQYFKSIIPE